MSILSILIPVYNEENLLEQSIDRIIAASLPPSFEIEIIIVDDASTDSTPEIIRKLCRKYHNITAIMQPQNKGKGAAIRLAINIAKGDYIIFQDADLEYNPNDYYDLLIPLIENKADVVYGSRLCKSDSKKVTFSYYKFGNKFLTFIVNFITGLKLTDMETCYKIFRSNIIKSIPLQSNRFEIEIEITVKIAKQKWRISEVPINYNGRDFKSGKKLTWKDGIIAIWTLLKYKIFYRSET
ncbi:MAG: glycosyltransferase family 2 protein [Planctomycetaceae bacterium]|jgi:glycosyltransferase involved in cell wall biosynthesis|nr:glycosyltransferase family 2 protein [Planctomycetaceae bacterium]